MARTADAQNILLHAPPLFTTPTPQSTQILLDVPSKQYDYDLAAWLASLGALHTLRAVVITRLAPERVPPLKAVLAAALAAAPPGAPPLRLLASNPALRLLRERAEADAELADLLQRAAPEAAARGTELALGGGGGALRFFPVPTPRWPDLPAVYHERERVLFSSSLFAAHAAAPLGSPAAGSAFDDGGWEAHGAAWRFYFDCNLAPAARQTATALERLRLAPGPPPPDAGVLEPLAAPARGLAAAVRALMLGADDGAAEPLAAALLCPVHGPVVRGSAAELVRRYGDWTAEQVAAAGAASVAVMYASAYGNTAALADAISRGVTKAGVGVESLNLEVAGAEEVASALAAAAGFAVGSPTLGGHLPTQVQTALGAVLRSADARALPCGVFGSFGWSGEAVDILEGRLKDAGFGFAFPAIRVKFKPTESALRAAEEAGTDLAQAVKKNLRRKERTAAASASVAESASGGAQALGRVVGSLCVVTAAGGGAASAMLASWVSQASFDPPGLTVAVKKDRAVEALLCDGAEFVLSVLAEGRERGAVKALSKAFAPGEARLAGVPLLATPPWAAAAAAAEGAGEGADAAAGPSAADGAVLAEAAAALRCRVLSRLEAGDHWVLYAAVLDAAVLDEGAAAAVHHRKVGSSY
jgi:flavorubredoxin/flavin reductase (DIM6/NTAB) family NADH-FMN oxidoreductase RutF